MGYAKDIRTVTEMKTRSAQLLREVNEGKRPLIITQDGKARAVLMDVESYDELRNTIGLLKLVAQGEEDIRRGRWITHDQLVRQVEARLRSALKRARKKS